MRNVFTRSASPLREFPKSGFKVCSNVEKLEEENWDWYRPTDRDSSTLFILAKSSNRDTKYWANLDMVRARRHGFVVISGGCCKTVMFTHY